MNFVNDRKKDLSGDSRALKSTNQFIKIVETCKFYYFVILVFIV